MRVADFLMVTRFGRPLKTPVKATRTAGDRSNMYMALMMPVDFEATRVKVLTKIEMLCVELVPWGITRLDIANYLAEHLQISPEGIDYWIEHARAHYWKEINAGRIKAR